MRTVLLCLGVLTFSTPQLHAQVAKGLDGLLQAPFLPYQHGLALAREGRHDEAIELFNTVIKQQPDNAAAYCQRGYSWREKEAFDKAIADFDESIRLDPSGPAHFQRALCRMRKGEPALAMADLDEAIRLHPTAVAYSVRGNCRACLGSPPRRGR